MQLYEYNQRFSEYLATDPFDEETGEFLEPDFAMEKPEAIDNYIAWYKNQTSLQDGIKAEIKALQERSKRIDRTVDFIKRQLEMATEGAKWESPKGKISYRSSESLVIDDEAQLINAGFFRQKIEPDKINAKKAIKEGQTVAGCHLEKKRSMTIK